MIKRGITALVAVGLLATACGSDKTTSSTSSAPPTTTGTLTTSSAAPSSSSGASGTIVVYAAASLTESFTAIGKAYEAAHPGTTITFDFGASSALATKITSGESDADVFASASTKNMDSVVMAGAAAGPTTFVKNTMEIAVPPDNPGKVTQLSDLAKADVQVALCQKEVPCGATAVKVFANAMLTVKPVTEEADVKSTLAKVESGDVDAGVVYVTDVLAAGSKVKGIPIPDAVNASTSYPIAPLSKSKNSALAADFVAYVLSDAGISELTKAGFSKP